MHAQIQNDQQDSTTEFNCWKIMPTLSTIIADTRDILFQLDRIHDRAEIFIFT